MLGFVSNARPLQILIDEGAVDSIHARLRGGIDEHPVDDVGEVVAGLPVHGPRSWQGLEGSGDLLYDQIDGQLSQPGKILRRIEQAVRVIDPQPVDLSLLHELQAQPMCGGEHRLVLHAQRGQVVDIEEPPIVDIVRRHPPIREPKRLIFQQLVQGIETHRLRGIPAQAAYGRLDGGGDSAVGNAQGREACLAGLLVAMALGALFRSRLESVRELRERAPEDLQIRVGDVREGAIQNARISARVQRKTMLVIEHDERAVVVLESQLDLAAFQHDPVGVAEHGHQNLVGQGRIGGRPVNVEVLGIDGGFAIFQNVHPPGIVRTHDSNMVGHDVEHVPHVMGAQGRDELFEFLARADLGVEGVVIDNVVAVHASGACAEIGRAIQMADTECGQIGNDAHGVAESEARVELNAIGRSRNDRGARHSHGGVDGDGAGISPCRNPAPAAR